MKAGDQDSVIDGVRRSILSMRCLPFYNRTRAALVHVAAMRDGHPFELDLQPVMADPGERAQTLPRRFHP